MDLDQRAERGDRHAREQTREALGELRRPGRGRAHRGLRHDRQRGRPAAAPHVAGGADDRPGRRARGGHRACWRCSPSSHETGSHLLAGVAFGIGFIALLLARSELFTEGFLVPVTAVVAGRASPRQLGKLWGGTLVANLAGGWLVTWLIIAAFPQFKQTAVESATTFVHAPLGIRSVALALLAGSTMTLMTRMQHGTTSDPAKMIVAVGGRLPARRAEPVPLDPRLADHLRGHPRRRAVRLRRLAGLVLVHRAAQRGRRAARRHRPAAAAQQGPHPAGAGRRPQRRLRAAAQPRAACRTAAT